MKEIEEFTFGFELEFTGISKEKAVKAIREGVMSEDTFEYNSMIKHFKILDPDLKRSWILTKDGSISGQSNQYGVILPAGFNDYANELVSPILTYTPLNLQKIEDICRCLKDAGAITNETCGIHVHIGIPDKFKRDVRFLKNLCNISFTRGTLLKKVLNVYPEREEFCLPLTYTKTKRINEKQTRHLKFEEFKRLWYENNRAKTAFNEYQLRSKTRYNFINLHPILSGIRDAIEFRGYNATTRFEYLHSYILFSYLITLQAVKQKYITLKESSGDYKKDLESWLNSLDANGEEFAFMRKMLFNNLAINTPALTLMSERIVF
jgi:hypothetical protein